MATSTIIPPAAAKTVADMNTALDGKKFYNSVTDLGLTAGSATLTDTWNAMANNSMGLFSGTDFPVSELPGTQTGIVIIHRLLSSRGVILWAAKNQTDGTKNQLCVMQWSSNVPSGVWRDIANLTAADVGAVPTTRKVNNKALSADVTLTASDIGLPDSDAPVNRYTLNAGATVNLTLTGNTCFFTLQRYGSNSTHALCIAEYWNNRIAVFGALPSQIVLQKNSSSNVITIQNNRGTGVVLTAVSGAFAAVESTEPLTETAIRMNFAPQIPVSIENGGTGASGTEDLSSRIVVNDHYFNNSGSSYRRFGNVHWLRLFGSMIVGGADGTYPIATLKNDSGNNMFPPFASAVGHGSRSGPLEFYVQQGIDPAIQVKGALPSEMIELNYTWVAQ